MVVAPLSTAPRSPPWHRPAQSWIPDQPTGQLGNRQFELGNPPIFEVLHGLAASWLRSQADVSTLAKLRTPPGEVGTVQTMLAQQRGCGSRKPRLAPECGA